MSIAQIEKTSCPHPDRASEEILGSAAGKFIFESMIAALQNKTAAKAA